MRKQIILQERLITKSHILNIVVVLNLFWALSEAHRDSDVYSSSHQNEFSSLENHNTLMFGLLIALMSCIGGAFCCYKQRSAEQTIPSTKALERGEVPLRTTGDLPQFKHSLSPERAEKHTIVGKKYALMNKISRAEAGELYPKKGIRVTFEEGEKKVKFILGKGQFGKLRLARDIETQEFVGVKKIKGKQEIDMSKSEARLQLKLKDKPYIMPILGTVETVGSSEEPVLYQFMPLALFNGDELEERLHCLESKYEAEKDFVIIHLAYSLLSGLHHMHESSIFHLDIKPSNLVVNQAGEIYIIDFGCAVKGEDSNHRLTSANGDTRYYSPERLESSRRLSRGEKNVSFNGAKADAWAAGLTLLEIGFGYYPFDVCHFGEKLKHWDETYFQEKLEAVGPLQCPLYETIWSVVKGLLNVDPSARLSVEQALQMPALVQYAKDMHSTLETLQKRAFNEDTLLKELPSSPEKSAQSGPPIPLSLPKEHDENYAETYDRLYFKNNKIYQDNHILPTPTSYDKTPATQPGKTGNILSRDYDKTPVNPRPSSTLFQPHVGDSNGYDLVAAQNGTEPARLEGKAETFIPRNHK